VLGIPLEGIGFSGNPKIWKGIPPFDRTRFAFAVDRDVVEIRMRYLL
jgi:uncharacterized protein (DUF2141 family)